jgi:phosphoribosylglycinamide formyltransferase 1
MKKADMKICWFTTGRDKDALTLLKDVYDAIEKGVIKGEITLVFMNRERNESETSDEIIEFVEQKGITIELLSTKRFLAERGLKLSEARDLFYNEVKSKIEKYDFDMIFLAGYMLIIGPALLDRYLIINIHPSLPGAYKGKWEDVIMDTIRDGVKHFGAMVHVVDAVLDEGPPISFARLALEGPEINELYDNAHQGDKVSEDRLFHIMREREFAVETPLIIQTLAMLSNNEIVVKDKKVFYKGVEVDEGVDITENVLTVN